MNMQLITPRTCRIPSALALTLVLMLVACRSTIATRPAR